MEDDTAIFCNGSRRRWWLLKKALEDHSLADALKIAKEAEAFITVAKEANSADGMGHGSQIPPATRRESALSAIPVSEVNAFPSEERSKFDLLESNLIQYSEAVCLSGDTRFSYFPRHRTLALSNQAEASEAESEVTLMPSDTASSTFAVMTSIQQVVTFLCQCDYVVVSTPEGKFLVNGRFRENTTELLRRANRIRNRQGKPPFEVLVSTNQNVK